MSLKEVVGNSHGLV